MTAPLERVTTVDALAAALRARILDGGLAPGTPLREQALADDYRVARHTLRAALRALVTEGLAIAEPHRGVRVRALDRPGLEALAQLRVALEVEGARLALARHAGRLPAAVHAAAAAFAATCASTTAAAEPSPPDPRSTRSGHRVVEIVNPDGSKAQPPPRAAPRAADAAVGADDRRADGRGWAAVTDAHEALHHAIVAASGSPRIVAAHAALGGELRLFLAALRPTYDRAALAADHHALVRALEARGPEVLRAHIAASTAILASRLAD